MATNCLGERLNTKINHCDTYKKSPKPWFLKGLLSTCSLALASGLFYNKKLAQVLQFIISSLNP